MYRIGLIVIIMLISCSIGGIGNIEDQVEIHNKYDLIDHESMTDIMNNSIIDYPILWSNGRCCS